METTKWVCETWYQNRDGDEVSRTETFASKEEAENYGKRLDGTFNSRGRLAVAFEVYPWDKRMGVF
jgi:hypothetical protein